MWDMVCGTIGRPCPKLVDDPERVNEIGPFVLPPPCLYVLPATIPSPRNNPHPPAQSLDDVELLKAFSDCFKCQPEEVTYVDFEIAYKDADTVRTTRAQRDGEVQRKSDPTAIRRA